MAVISAVNLKGGVGKTSLVMHATGTLAQLGRRVLVVDVDPQASATSGFLGLDSARRLDPSGTIHAVLAGADPYPEDVIRSTPFEGVELLAGSRHAVEYNLPMPHRLPYEDQTRLRDFLTGVRDRYHVVLIDCPPNLHLASYAALSASDGYIVPLMAEDFGAQGTLDVAESVALVRGLVNPGLATIGYVLTKFAARRSLHKVYGEQIRGTFGAEVFDAVMPEAADYAESIALLKPVAFHKPKGAAAKAMRAVVEELLERLDRIATDRVGEAA